MRIVAGLAADELRDDDLLAAGGLVGAEQLLHPGVIVDAVDDDDLRVGERLRGLGARLEQMRVLVRIAEDARHGDGVAADLAGDVAVEVLGGDDLHRVGERWRGDERGSGEGGGDERAAEHCGLLEREGAAWSAASDVLCYNIARRKPLPATADATRVTLRGKGSELR